MNVVTLDGNLASDPSELRKAGEGEVRDLRLAHRFGKDTDDTLFVDVEVWNGWARNFRGKKGDPIVVTGEIRENHWKTKDGDPRSRVFIRAREVKVLERKPKDASPSA